MQNHNFGEQRFDDETQVKVVQLAAQLQEQHRSTATVAEIAAVAEEVGIEPRFVDQALQKMASDRLSERTDYAPGPLWNRVAWTVSILSCITSFIGAHYEARSGGQIAALLCLAAVVSIGAAAKRTTLALGAGWLVTLMSAGFAWSLGGGSWFIQNFQDAMIAFLFSAAGGSIAAVSQIIWRSLRTRRG